MKGCLQKKHGKYYAVISFKNDCGEWQKKWINTNLPVKDNLRKAEKFLFEKIAEYSASNIKPSKNILFIDYMYEWLETMRSSIEPNTYESYKATINVYVKPHFAKTKINLQTLEPRDIQEFYNKQIKNGLSATTVLSQHANIRKALQHAVKMNIIPYNPADRVTLPKKVKYNASYYTAEQVTEMLTVFESEEMYSAVLLASFYGLRRSEVLGLKWKHVDFDTDTVTIQDTVVKCGKVAAIDKPRTKTTASHRVLPLPKPLYDYLIELKLCQEKNKALLGAGYIQNDYVCVRPNGESFKPNYITCRFNKVLKKANLDHIRFHDLRHSAASILLADEFSMFEISKWLGHGELATTANIYAHLQFQAKKDMADSMGERLRFSLPKFNSVDVR